MLTDEHFDQLVQEVQILQLINHRNKNQHRLLTWWKYFRLLLSQLKRLVILQHHPLLEQNPSQQDVIDKLFQKKIFTRCYYEFNGIIALGQFLLLGLTLVGSLSKVHEILVLYKVDKSTAPVQTAPLGEELGEEIEFPVANNDNKVGLEFLDKKEGTDLRSPEPTSNSNSTKRKHDSKEKKKKKKKKKTDIDMLFD